MEHGAWSIEHGAWSIVQVPGCRVVVVSGFGIKCFQFETTPEYSVGQTDFSNKQNLTSKHPHTQIPKYTNIQIHKFTNSLFHTSTFVPGLRCPTNTLQILLCFRLQWITGA